MTNQGQTPAVPNLNEFLDSWRKAASETEQRWNDYLNEMMGTEAFGQSLARSMDGLLSVQAAWARGMEQYLRALNIPTRSDVTALAERVALLEQKIDGVAAMLGAEASAAPTTATRTGAKRTRAASKNRKVEG